ncbi:MAG: HmuY family protein [Chitinophagaceae bacterium]|nr:HmuY family protein [Chitinophagaceae bacterium]
MKNKHQLFCLLNQKKYTIRVADINGDNDREMTIPKNDNYNFQFLFLNPTEKLIDAEPIKTDWDIVFTQYTHVFYDMNPPTPYLVTGCLTNRYETMALMDSTTSYENINYEYAITKILSTEINTIGYTWKVYSQDVYITNPKLNYIIRTQDGAYYKLHFIDFYDSNGNKGTPTFEYQKL